MNKPKSQEEICPLCSHKLHLADWPFCPHESTRRVDAQRMLPTVVWKDPETGKYAIPGSATSERNRKFYEKKGWERIEITNGHQRDALYKDLNAQEKRRYERHMEAQEANWGSYIQRNREELKREVEKFVTPEGRRFADVVMAYYDSQRQPNFDAGCHLEAFEYDAQNRQECNDPETQRRYRR